jgi:hypothetical protein
MTFKEFLEEMKELPCSAKSVKAILATNVEDALRLRLTGALIVKLNRSHYEELDGCFEDGAATYALPGGLARICFRFPGGPSITGQGTLTKSAAAEFKRLMEKEEETGDEGWREDLDEDEELALDIFENDGEIDVEYYYSSDSGLLLADEMDCGISDNVNSAEPDQTWDELSSEELAGIAERLSVRPLDNAGMAKNLALFVEVTC